MVDVLYKIAKAQRYHDLLLAPWRTRKGVDSRLNLEEGM